MKTPCPTCGAEVEFRYDDSFVRICSHCRSAVLRSDRGVETLGKVGDLVPMDSPLRLFADGHFGSSSFILIGMAQLRHSAGGMWQEWYAKLDGGKWGWLAEAQGRFYLTFEQPMAEFPPQLSFSPGATAELPVHGQLRTFKVAEMGSASYVSAAGELPYRLVPSGSFRFVDLAAADGTVATIDYGEDGDKPALYVGSQVALPDLGMRGGEVVAPAQGAAIKSVRLACPNCNGSLEIHAPGQTQRIVCAYCNHLLDATSPTLAVVEQLQSKPTPDIPLGSKGTFLDGPMTVIGYVQRSAQVDDEWWPFYEYLLFEPTIGFRWLVQSDGHWSYVQPVANGAIETAINGAKYDGVKFRSFQSAPLRVDQVLGEFYWQVHAGEIVQSEDLIAPPAMLSRESDEHEENWSLSTYMTVKQVQHAFGDKGLPLGTPTGIAPNQPDSLKRASDVMSLGFLALIVLGIVFAAIAPDKQVLRQVVSAPPVSAPAALKLAAIPECADYKAAADLAATCTQLDPTTRASIKLDYDTAVAGFATLTIDSAPSIAASCELAGQRVKLATTGCAAASSVAPECADYRAVVDAIQTCSRVSLHAREQFAADYQHAVADGRGDVPVCTAGAAAVRDSATLGNCNVPAPSTAPTASTSAAPELPSNVVFSDPFELDAGQNIELTFSASTLANSWAYVAVDIVNEATGAVITVDTNIEYYYGVDDGESWHEGDNTSREVVGPQPAGTYLVRIETQHGGTSDLPLAVTVKQGVFRFTYLALALVLLSIPLVLVGIVSWSHERTRWSNSTSGKAPTTPVSVLLALLGGGFVLIWWLLKAILEMQSDSDDT